MIKFGMVSLLCVVCSDFPDDPKVVWKASSVESELCAAVDKIQPQQVSHRLCQVLTPPSVCSALQCCQSCVQHRQDRTTWITSDKSKVPYVTMHDTCMHRILLILSNILTLLVLLY